MAQSVKPGDRVHLNSGGPTMTVERVFEGTQGEQKATCQWFEKDELKSGHFAVASLTLLG